MTDLLESLLVGTASFLVAPGMCSVQLLTGIAHLAIYLHLGTCQRRVATDFRVFSVIT